ncbi:MAG: hypothetical protein ABIB47_06160 [Candidatus Woesearchaeota archaeon]
MNLEDVAFDFAEDYCNRVCSRGSVVRRAVGNLVDEVLVSGESQINTGGKREGFMCQVILVIRMNLLLVLVFTGF